MKKSTKAALAAVGAGVLLTGGATTLAFWSDSATVGASTLTAGTLTLGEADCSAWVLDANEDAPGETATLLVPGDVATQPCTFDIAATGDHLRANLAAVGAVESGDLADDVEVDTTFDVDGQTVTSITEDDDDAVLTSTVTVTFPYGDAVDNDSQGESVSLTDYVVTATQVHSDTPVAPVAP